MFGKKKEPMVFVIKSDDLDDAVIQKIKKELKEVYPDKRIAVIGVANDEDVYAISG